MARHGTARHGTAQHSTVSHSIAHYVASHCIALSHISELNKPQAVPYLAALHRVTRTAFRWPGSGSLLARWVDLACWKLGKEESAPTGRQELGLYPSRRSNQRLRNSPRYRCLFQRTRASGTLRMAPHEKHRRRVKSLPRAIRSPRHSVFHNPLQSEHHMSNGARCARDAGGPARRASRGAARGGGSWVIPRTRARTRAGDGLAMPRREDNKLYQQLEKRYDTLVI